MVMLLKLIFFSNVHFRCGTDHTKNSWKKIGVRNKLQPSLLKQEVELYEIYEVTWEAEEDEWLPYHKNDVLSTVFCHTIYSRGMEN